MDIQEWKGVLIKPTCAIRIRSTIWGMGYPGLYPVYITFKSPSYILHKKEPQVPRNLLSFWVITQGHIQKVCIQQPNTLLF